ncbi:MAG: hypothetical protein WC057_02050 [Dehalococcoidales bacterium]|jgi:hypothetical protein
MPILSEHHSNRLPIHYTPERAIETAERIVREQNINGLERTQILEMASVLLACAKELEEVREENVTLGLECMHL